MGLPHSYNAFSAKWRFKVLVDFRCGTFRCSSFGVARQGWMLSSNICNSKVRFFVVKGQHYLGGTLREESRSIWGFDMRKFLYVIAQIQWIKPHAFTCWSQGQSLEFLYSSGMRMYFDVLKTKSDTAQGKENWVGLEWKPNSLSPGRVRSSSLLGTSQYFVCINFKSFEGLDPSGKADLRASLCPSIVCHTSNDVSQPYFLRRIKSQY